MTAPLSTANRALLERKLGKPVPAGDFVIRLQASALNSILDAARSDAGEKLVGRKGMSRTAQDALDRLCRGTTSTAAGDIEEILADLTRAVRR